MQRVKPDGAFRQAQCTAPERTKTYFNFLASKELMPVVNNTMLTELMGISIAAITGCSVPCVAKNKPTRL